MTAPDFNIQRWSGGHTDTVLCLDCSASGVIVSGSENGECVLWNEDGKVIETLTKCEDGVTSVCFSQRDPTKFFLSSGSNILEYDCKNLSEPIWTCSFNQEEINQLALNCNEELLASGDDSGQVKVIQLREKRVYKTLRKHSNICTGVRFRRKKQWELVSGSMDECAIHWECGRGRALTVLSMQDFGEESNPGGAYLVNPPLVHSVDISENDRLLACGLENATVELFEFRGKRGICERACLRGHTQGVSQVHFPRFQANARLLSAGNDGKIILWDISGDPEESDQTAGTSETANSSEVAGKKPAQLSLIDHRHKVNWITSMKTESKDLIYIADQTNSISQYTII